MDIKVIGTAPEELSRRFTLSSYVVDGQLAIDAGSLGIVWRRSPCSSKIATATGHRR